MHNENSSAFQAGRLANQDGEPRSDCPYGRTQKIIDWLAGWDQAQEVRAQWEADNHERCQQSAA